MAAVTRKDFDNEIKKIDSIFKERLDAYKVDIKNLNDSLNFYRGDIKECKTEFRIDAKKYEAAYDIYKDSFYVIYTIIGIVLAIGIAIGLTGFYQYIKSQVKKQVDEKLKAELNKEIEEIKKEIKKDYEAHFYYSLDFIWDIMMKDFLIDLANNHELKSVDHIRKEITKKLIDDILSRIRPESKRSIHSLEITLKSLDKLKLYFPLFTPDDINSIKSKINDLKPQNEEEKKIIQNILDIFSPL